MEETTLFDKTSWVILLGELEYKALEDNPNYKIAASMKHPFNEGFYIAEIEPLYEQQRFLETGSYEPDDDEIEDVLVETDALAIHEPFTNAVFVTRDSLDILSEEIYTWNGSGSLLIGDLLNDIERLAFILDYYNSMPNRTKMVTIKDLKIVEKKDTPGIPLEDNVQKLFGDVYGIECEGDEQVLTIWYPYIIEGSHTQPFLVVVDDDAMEEEPDEDYPLIPIHKYDDDHYRYPYSAWDDYDDYYDYDDRFYGRT